MRLIVTLLSFLLFFGCVSNESGGGNGSEIQSKQDGENNNYPAPDSDNGKKEGDSSGSGKEDGNENDKPIMDEDPSDNDPTHQVDEELKDDSNDSEYPNDTDQERLMVLNVISPTQNDVTENGKDVSFTLHVSDSEHPADQLKIKVSSDVGGELFEGTPQNDGTFNKSINSLAAGYHQLTFTLTAPDNMKTTKTIQIGICKYRNPESFDGPNLMDGWEIFGDATLDPGGWLEMTGNAQAKQGSIYNTAQKVYPGDISLSFTIRTGSDVPDSGNKGADGFAINILNVETADQVKNYVNSALNGGCLGYGVTGVCVEEGQNPMIIESFHIEFDTHNNSAGTYKEPTDPTPDNHIAVTLNGDPGDHKLFKALPDSEQGLSDLEDMLWHEITLKTKGPLVTITMDGKTVINQEIEGFNFRGGYIGFSGTTGGKTNYHSFDNLQIMDRCLVPNR